MLSRASHSCVVREFWREVLGRRLRRLELEVVEFLVLDWVERDMLGLVYYYVSGFLCLYCVAHCDGSRL
jgi:hypothetical protein